MIDIDELDALYKQSTPGEWHLVHNGCVKTLMAGTVQIMCFGCTCEDVYDFPESIVAAHNALPELIREVRAARALRAQLDTAVRLLHMLDNIEARHPDVAEFLDDFEAAALTATLDKQRKARDEHRET